MRNKMILESEYLKSKKIVDDYNEQLKQAVVKSSELYLDQQVRSTVWKCDFWVSEILGNDVLLRTTEDEEDDNYEDIWVNIASIYF